MAKMIAGTPEDALNAHNEEVAKMKVKAFDFALSLAYMTPDALKYTGYKSAGEALIQSAKQIEKLTVALEKKYPA